jgi:hypothetical protein
VLLAALLCLSGTILALSGCGASSHLDQTGILLVDVGEPVQGRGPVGEDMAQAESDAWVFSEDHGADVGYPWVDPSTNELVVSAVTAEGRSLLEGLTYGVPHRIRDVQHGAKELRDLQDAATFFRSQGVPGGDLVIATLPDERDNRALIVINAMSRPLLDYLAAHYPPDAVAIQVDTRPYEAGPMAS